MKIIVTGGTGLIGTALVRDLISAGHDITVLTRNAGAARSQAAHSQVAHAHHVQWAAKGDGEWMSCVDGSDAVINLAGESLGARRWTPNQKERIISSRVDATGAIV